VVTWVASEIFAKVVASVFEVVVVVVVESESQSE
jgi:hypothetical protein